MGLVIVHEVFADESRDAFFRAVGADVIRMRLRIKYGQKSRHGEAQAEAAFSRSEAFESGECLTFDAIEVLDRKRGVEENVERKVEARFEIGRQALHADIRAVPPCG